MSYKYEYIPLDRDGNRRTMAKLTEARATRDKKYNKRIKPIDNELKRTLSKVAALHKLADSLEQQAERRHDKDSLIVWKDCGMFYDPPHMEHWPKVSKKTKAVD